MKKLFSLLLVLLFLPIAPAGLAEENAREIPVEIHNGNDKQTDGEALRDGSDETGLALKKGKEGSLYLLLPEDGSCASIALRLTAEPAKVELQTQNEKKKWETVIREDDPGVQFSLDTLGIKGKVKLVLSFSAATACTVLEARCFGSGVLPESFHSWKKGGKADILLAAQSLEAIDTTVLGALLSAGRDVAVAAMRTESSLPAAWDRLWDAGLRTMPTLYDPNVKKPDAAGGLASWCRKFQPLLLATDTALSEYATAAVSNAADPAWNREDAAVNSIWAVPDFCVFSQAEEKAEHLADRSGEAIRSWCEKQFESAQHADPSKIPYPATRLPDGYLPEGEGEFIFEDEEEGLWAYLSSTLQVEIIRYAMPEVPHRWFEAHVIFKPDQESFQQHTYINATFKGQQIYPETLAQTSKLVFAVNGDYYPNRADQKWPVGNIIRQRQVLYNYDAKRSLKFPNLDTLAIRDDGSFSVYAGNEISATELLAQGDVHDALSFGPYLVRDGQMRIYNGNSADVPEPRCAYGMVEPGHLFFVMVEGKMPKKGEQGFSLWTLAELMYARGCTQAMNVDGGSTAVMVFMGHKLNRTGKATTLGSPRNQHELFGIGSSDNVYTDMADGKKK